MTTHPTATETHNILYHIYDGGPLALHMLMANTNLATMNSLVKSGLLRRRRNAGHYITVRRTEKGDAYLQRANKKMGEPRAAMPDINAWFSSLPTREAKWVVGQWRNCAAAGKAESR